MHQWWNAFGDKQSAFARQQYNLGDYKFHFAKEEALGGYEDIVYSQKVALSVEPYVENGVRHSDIIKLNLAESVAPGQTTRIHFEYKADIPETFGRPGFDGDMYRMTQWYPKPAVYDVDGWHPMPYLSIGEFYAEYGDYEVTIELPQEFKLVATGTKSSEDSFLPDNEDHSWLRTTYTAQNVLDFAWFASPVFILDSKKIKVDDKEVVLHLFSDLDTSRGVVMGYVEDAVRFYSDKVGSYAYPQYTLVLNSDGSRGGMEYPMISMVDHSVVGQNMDNLIAHEIGHNWFQSMLGSNERTHPWMDEGLNSFYERAYNDSKYEESNNALIPPFLKAKQQEFTAMRAGVSHLYCCGKLGAIDQCSEDTDAITYVSNSYERMAWNLQYLQAYLGESFNEGMQAYFQKWLNKHPQPDDLQATLERHSDKDLTWFFDGTLKENKPFDYKIKSVSGNHDLLDVKIANRSEFDIPVVLDCYDEEGVLLHSEWVEPIDQKHIIPIPQDNYSRITINGETPFQDIERRNNHYYLDKKLFPSRPRLSTKFVGRHGDSKASVISYIPSLTYNNYDGLMLGALLYNDFYPYNNTRWMVQPSYGIQSGDVAGRFAIEHDFKKVAEGSRRFTLGLSGQRFNWREVRTEDIFLDYFKLEPSLTMHFNRGLIATGSLSYKLHHINQITFSGGDRVKDYIHQLNYRTSSPTRLGRADLLLQAEYESYQFLEELEKENYLKLSLDYKRKFNYSQKSQFFFRFFASYFPINSRRESSSFSDVFTHGSIALSQQGFTDHTFENYYLGRSEQTGLLSRQFVEEEGGFKMPLGSAFSTGMSNDYLFAVNLKSDLPYGSILFFELRPFFDAAVTSTKSFTAEELSPTFFYSGGIALEVLNIGGIYIPLVYSEAFDAPLAGRDFLSRISFKLDLAKINPWRLVENPGILIK